MKVKTWVCYIKNSPEWYYVDAPSKRIAKWCGAACYNHEYCAFATAKDVDVERFKYEEKEDED